MLSFFLIRLLCSIVFFGRSAGFCFLISYHVFVGHMWFLVLRIMWVDKESGVVSATLSSFVLYLPNLPIGELAEV